MTTSASMILGTTSRVAKSLITAGFWDATFMGFPMRQALDMNSVRRWLDPI
jgi:hypothetical protein